MGLVDGLEACSQGLVDGLESLANGWVGGSVLRG